MEWPVNFSNDERRVLVDAKPASRQSVTERASPRLIIRCTSAMR